MNRRQILFIITLTVTVVIALSVMIAATIRSVNQQIEQACFDNLADSSKLLAKELATAANYDRTVLTAMADIIAALDKPSDEKLCEILRTYRFHESYVSYTELLQPDNTMLDADGTVRDVSTELRFADEAAQGARISNLVQSTRNPGERVVRNAIPVVQNGKTIYMLYGVVRISELAEKYRTDIYDHKAFVFIMDGDSGDFILDTWHTAPGNILDFTNRKLEPGYTWDAALSELKAGESGRLAFTSVKINGVVFLRYDPIGINNWNVLIVVPQEIALHESETVSHRLYRMAAWIGAVMLLYMACVTWCLLCAYRKVLRLGKEDQTTGLQNRNAYDRCCANMQNRCFPSLTCVYVDVNGLHEVNNQFGHQAGDQMLQIVAEAMKKEFPYKQLFRIGGDEFVAFSEVADVDACEDKMTRVVKQVAAYDYNIAYGVSNRINEVGASRVTQEADERMLENKRAFYALHDRRR